MSEQDSEHWWFVARRQVLTDQLAAMKLGPDAKILEAGCGPGGNLEMLGHFGALEAFELDDEARAIASKRSGLDVAGGALPDEIDYAPGSYDLIAAFDVIEHIEDDKGSVRALAELLKPGGRLVITVPAYQWLWSKHDERHHHFRRYQRGEVRALAVQAGLEIEKSSYFNTILMPLIVAVRVLKTILGKKDSPDDRIPGPVVNGSLRRIFAFERFWLRYGTFPFGVSVLCIARKG